MGIMGCIFASKASYSMQEKSVVESNLVELISLKSDTQNIHSTVKECNNVPDNITPKSERKRHVVWCQIKHFLFAARNTLLSTRSNHESNTYVAYEKVDELSTLDLNPSNKVFAKRESVPYIDSIKEKIRKETEKFIESYFETNEAKLKNLPQDSLEYQIFQNVYGSIFSMAKDDFVSYCKEHKIPLKSEKANACFASMGNMALLYGMDGEVDNKLNYFSPRCIGSNAFITSIMSPIVSLYFSELSSDNKKYLMSYAEEMMISKFSEKSQSYEEYQGRDPRDFRTGLSLVLDDHKSLMGLND